ncbi:MAG TPA: tetratricopeptide repeat protein, partial [Pyrinomonadaceae bacterium]|nr:tetratricopeptide repeat protein [Pyrinomonadaceae bacterium]
AYYGAGQSREAIESLKQAIALRPDYAEAHNSLGVAYYKLKRYREATAAFTEAIRLKPDFALARYNLGATGLVTNRREAALEQYGTLKTLSSELAGRLYDGLYQGMVLSVRER